jgi:hypothetical protein
VKPGYRKEAKISTTSLLMSDQLPCQHTGKQALLCNRLSVVFELDSEEKLTQKFAKHLSFFI